MSDTIQDNQLRLLAERAGYGAVEREVEWQQAGYEGEFWGETFRRKAWFIEHPDMPPNTDRDYRNGGCHTEAVAWQMFLSMEWKPDKNMNQAKQIIDGFRSGKGCCWNFALEMEYGGLAIASFKYYTGDHFTGRVEAYTPELAICLAALEAMGKARDR